MSYKNANNLLKILGVNENITNILHNNPFFYRKLAELSLNFQYGGDYNIRLPEDDDEIVMKEYNIGKNKAFSILSRKRDKKGNWIEMKDNSACLLLLKIKDSIHIETLDIFDACVTVKGQKMNGSNLVKIALDFIESIKVLENIKYITLLDKSEKTCDDKENIKNQYNIISLTDFKILISGDSWYGGYGFIPAKVINREYYVDKNAFEKYKKNKEIIKNLTVRNSKIIDIINKKLEEINNEKLIKFLKYLKEKKNEKLSDAIKDYLTPEKFKRRCIALNLIINELFIENKLESFNNKPFIKKL